MTVPKKTAVATKKAAAKKTTTKKVTTKKAVLDDTMLDDTALDNTVCRVCGKPILVSIFKNSGLCSLNCSKIERGEKVASPVVANTDCA